MTMSGEHETLTQFLVDGSGRRRLDADYSGGLRRIKSPSIGGSEMGNCQILSFIQTLIIKSSRSFQRADPFVAGREEDPAVGFGIARSQHHRVGVEGLRAQKLDELGRFFLVLAQASRFFVGDFGILLDLALGFEDHRIHVVLQFVGEFRRIHVGLENVVMTNEVDAHVRGKFELVLAGVGHAYEAPRR